MFAGSGDPAQDDSHPFQADRADTGPTGVGWWGGLWLVPTTEEWRKAIFSLMLFSVRSWGFARAWMGLASQVPSRTVPHPGFHRSPAPSAPRTTCFREPVEPSFGATPLLERR